MMSSENNQPSFSKYIALGDSLTAGYADGALSLEGQHFCYPNLIASQLGHPAIFRQPLVKDIAGIGFNGTEPRSRLVPLWKHDCKGMVCLQPSPGPVPDPDNLNYIGHLGPYHNLGIPGARSFHLLIPGYGSETGNPYFRRFATSTEASVLQDATAIGADFFSLWIGNNDVLAYGIAAGKSDPVTPVDKFEAYLHKILKKLTGKGARGIIATIPDVTQIPFFNTIPTGSFLPEKPEVIDLLNNQYKTAGLKFKPGYNPFVLQEAGKIRFIEEDEKILLDIPFDMVKCEGLGSFTPIPDRFVLKTEDLKLLASTTLAYNEIIRSMAARFDLALADINLNIRSWPAGIGFDQIRNCISYLPDGIFSLDGIHLSPKGCAVVANIFIEALNEKFRFNAPLTDPENFRGTVEKKV